MHARPIGNSPSAHEYPQFSGCCARSRRLAQLSDPRAGSSVRTDSGPQVCELASVDPTALLAGQAHRLIDEWQLAPGLWNVIRHEIDDRQARGQFILSGSSTPLQDPPCHSGAGRFGRLRMRPMSLAESGRSSEHAHLRTQGRALTA